MPPQKTLFLVCATAMLLGLWFFFQAKPLPKTPVVTTNQALDTDYPHIINYPQRDDHIIQSKHREINIDLAMPEKALDMGIAKAQRRLPSLEGWQSNKKGALGGNIKHISEKMIPESWKQDQQNPLKYQRHNDAYALEWKTEADRVVGMVAYFKPTSFSADMMSLQSLLAGQSEGWQIDWHRKENQKQREGVLSLSDGREIYYLMDFDPQASVQTPITVYFELNQRIHQPAYQEK